MSDDTLAHSLENPPRKKTTIKDYIDDKIKRGELDNVLLQRVSALQSEVTWLRVELLKEKKRHQDFIIEIANLADRTHKINDPNVGFTQYRMKVNAGWVDGVLNNEKIRQQESVQSALKGE